MRDHLTTKLRVCILPKQFLVFFIVCTMDSYAGECECVLHRFVFACVSVRAVPRCTAWRLVGWAENLCIRVSQCVWKDDRVHQGDFFPKTPEEGGQIQNTECEGKKRRKRKQRKNKKKCRLGAFLCKYWSVELTLEFLPKFVQSLERIICTEYCRERTKTYNQYVSLF